jgi:hypothetical protein
MSSISQSEPAPTLDDVWRLFRETEHQFQETERQFQETERQFQENDRKIKEARTETERRIRDAREQTERQFRETDRKIQEVSEQIGNLGNRLGEFVEGLVAPALVRLFQARGIQVDGLSRDHSRRNQNLNLAAQIDLLVTNGDVCIVVEVKSKLSIDDVNEHLERMNKFKPLFPEYADKKAYGSVAAMVIPDDVAKYAYRKGFFVLAQQGETVVILNDETFKPLAW